MAIMIGKKGTRRLLVPSDWETGDLLSPCWILFADGRSIECPHLGSVLNHSPYYEVPPEPVDDPDPAKMEKVT